VTCARTPGTLTSLSRQPVPGFAIWNRFLAYRCCRREPRGVNLTPAGHTLAHYARAVFQQIENLRGKFEEHTGGFKGQVRVFSGSLALNEFLPQALSLFLIEYPGVNIDVEERPSNEIIRAVVEGVVHIGIVSEPVSIAGLQTFSFKTDRLVLVAPKSTLNST
jgi:DNA-binding transcriptional LysR family regulator